MVGLIIGVGAGWLAATPLNATNDFPGFRLTRAVFVVYYNRVQNNTKGRGYGMVTRGRTIDKGWRG